MFISDNNPVRSLNIHAVWSLFSIYALEKTFFSDRNTYPDQTVLIHNSGLAKVFITQTGNYVPTQGHVHCKTSKD